MEDHYCQFYIARSKEDILAEVSPRECGALARFQIYYRWYCAEHYDALMASEQRAYRAGFEAVILRSKRG